MKTAKKIKLVLTLFIAVLAINAYAADEATKEIPLYNFSIINDTKDLIISYKLEDGDTLNLMGELPLGDDHSIKKMNQSFPVHLPITYNIKVRRKTDPWGESIYTVENGKLNDSTAEQKIEFIEGYRIENKMTFVKNHGTFYFRIFKEAKEAEK